MMNKLQEIKHDIINFFTKTVDWKEFWIGMGVFFVFFTAIAIGMVATKVWEFELMLFVYYYGGGLIVSAFFNLMNPNNQKKK